jgi:hypothetical protein
VQCDCKCHTVGELQPPNSGVGAQAHGGTGSPRLGICWRCTRRKIGPSHRAAQNVTQRLKRLSHALSGRGRHSILAGQRRLQDDDAAAARDRVGSSCASARLLACCCLRETMDRPRWHQASDKWRRRTPQRSMRVARVAEHGRSMQGPTPSFPASTNCGKTLQHRIRAACACCGPPCLGLLPCRVPRGHSAWNCDGEDGPKFFAVPRRSLASRCPSPPPYATPSCCAASLPFFTSCPPRPAPLERGVTTCQLLTSCQASRALDLWFWRARATPHNHRHVSPSNPPARRRAVSGCRRSARLAARRDRGR